MAAEWPILSLREANVRLIDCDHRTPPAADTGYPYVAIPQLRNGRIELSEARRITAEHFIEWTRKAKPIANDVVLSRRCNPGETAFVGDGMQFALGQNLVLLRADVTKVHPPFLRWLVRSPEWWEQIRKFLNVGAVFDSLKCADIPNFRLPIPSVLQQQAIACILGAPDEKIELNRRMNRTLEATVRAIFQSWFVDFDPVKAKARGQKPSGLKSDLVSFFPDAFQESELGQIPKGWRAAKIEEIAHINRSTLGRRDGLDFIDYIEISEVMRGEISVITRYVRGEEPSRARRRLQHGDTVLSTVRPDRGSYFLALNPADSLIASTGFAVLTPKDDNWAFLHTMTARPQFWQELGRLADGGAYPAIRPDIVGGRKIVLPNESRLIGAFEKSARPLFLRAEMNKKECRALAAIRDTLLPKLISGELRVSDAERIVGRAL